MINPHFFRLNIVYTASLNELLILQKIFNRTEHFDKNNELLIHLTVTGLLSNSS